MSDGEDAPPDAEESAYRALATRAKRARLSVAIPCLFLGFAGGLAGYELAYAAVRRILPTYWMAGIGGGIGFILPLVGAAYLALGLGRVLVRARIAAWVAQLAREFRVAPSLLEDAVKLWR